MHEEVRGREEGDRPPDSLVEDPGEARVGEELGEEEGRPDPGRRESAVEGGASEDPLGGSPSFSSPFSRPPGVASRIMSTTDPTSGRNNLYPSTPWTIGLAPVDRVARAAVVVEGKTEVRGMYAPSRNGPRSTTPWARRASSARKPRPSTTTLTTTSEA